VATPGNSSGKPGETGSAAAFFAKESCYQNRSEASTGIPRHVSLIHRPDSQALTPPITIRTNHDSFDH